MFHPAAAIIFLNDADPPANKETAPTGAYANSGWQYQLRYKNFQGTMISPKHFITAEHLGQHGAVSQPVHFNGVGEKTFTLKNGGAYTRIGTSDLAVFEIWETFEDFIPLYTGSNEVGKEFVLTGKGRGRGDTITRNSQTVGWKWGAPETEFDRWGVNEVLATMTTSMGDPLIYCAFDDDGGAFECQAAGNDSGGGWFIKDGATWKLAAINYSVDANHDTNNVNGDGSFFRAAFTEARGFYYGSDSGGWNLIPTSPAQYVFPSSYETNPSDIRFYDSTHSYGSRISGHVSEINSLIQDAITVAALSPTERMEAWLEDRGVTTMTSPLDDADGDGMINLLEYFSESDAGDAGQKESPLEVELLASGAVRFTLKESLDLGGRELTGVIQQSNDLENWIPVIGTSEQSNNPDAVNGWRTRVLTLASPAAAPSFYRLKVEIAD